jgi:hypothetical protein
MLRWLTNLRHIKPSACTLCSAWVKEKYCTNSKCYYHNHLQGCPINRDCTCPVLDATVGAQQLERENFVRTCQSSRSYQIASNYSGKDHRK